MTTEIVAAAKEWIAAVPGDPAIDKFEDQWRRFDQNHKPVITVFGSYDTGKSSLIRRLLVDSGVQVPEWLTISARHETFEVREIELGGCLLRDTPGLAVGADDVRGESNSQAAQSAIELTDVAIVTVTPQLATGEFEVVRDQIGGRWPAAALWFAISRFDEAGRDPDSDLGGYRELANRKIVELRESFGLSDATPVFVVAQDPFQLAGADRDVDRDIWDDSRAWDEMDSLAVAIEDLGNSDVSALRTATEERFWSRAAASVASDLRDALPALEAASVEAANQRVRGQQWSDELGTLDKAAQANLKGTLSESIRHALVNPDSGQDEIVSVIRSALDLWYLDFGRRLDLILQDVEKSAERTRSEPAWAQLDALVSSARSESGAIEGPEVRRLAPFLEKHGQEIASTLLEIERLYRKRSGPGSGSKNNTGGLTVSDKAKATKLVVQMMIGIARLVDDYRSKRAATQHEARLFADSLLADATATALEEWAKSVSDAREVVTAALGCGAHSADALRLSVEDLRAAIRSCPV
ncbi:GTPase domain-containing protein [Williamsia sp. CHRR-6]|uniref:GTPase domain-containing protein n=1 Tax=Williamsia sp. CHRR-6 TaxID=2835871 RepID=UPI001BD96850|nr:GTPase domain-containing protein [Williamsia sp. CHRR-6]MBT0566086.1 GTPase domain-containing protein [Williamsia sp. CHRR-6]